MHLVKATDVQDDDARQILLLQKSCASTLVEQGRLWREKETKRAVVPYSNTRPREIIARGGGGLVKG